MKNLILVILLFTSVAYSQNSERFSQERLERMYDNTNSFIKDKLSGLPTVKNWDDEIERVSGELKKLKVKTSTSAGFREHSDERKLEIANKEVELESLEKEKNDFESGEDIKPLKSFMNDLRDYTLTRSNIGASNEQLKKVEDLRGVYFQIANYLNLRKSLANSDCLDSQNDFKERVLTYSRSEIKGSLCTGYDGPQLKGEILNQDFDQLLSIVNKTNSELNQVGANIADYIIVPIDKKSDYEFDDEKRAWITGEVAKNDHLRIHKDNPEDRKSVAEVAKLNSFYQDVYKKNMENLTRQYIDNALKYETVEARKKLLSKVLDEWSGDNAGVLKKNNISMSSFPLNKDDRRKLASAVIKNNCKTSLKSGKNDWAKNKCHVNAIESVGKLGESVEVARKSGSSVKRLPLTKGEKGSYAHEVAMKFCHSKMDILAKAQCKKHILPIAMEQVDLTTEAMNAQNIENKGTVVPTASWKDVKDTVNSSVVKLNTHVDKLNKQKIKKQRKILGVIPSSILQVGTSSMKFETPEQETAYGDYMQAYNNELANEKGYGNFYLTEAMGMIPRDKDGNEETYHLGDEFEFDKLKPKNYLDVAKGVFSTQSDFVRAAQILGSDYSEMHKNSRSYGTRAGVGADTLMTEYALTRMFRTNPHSVAQAIMENPGYANSICRVISGMQNVIDDEKNVDNALMAAEVGTAVFGGGAAITRGGLRIMGKHISKQALKDFAIASSIGMGTSGALGGVDGLKHYVHDVPKAETDELLARTGYQSSDAKDLAVVREFAKKLEQENSDMYLATSFFVLGDVVVFNEIRSLSKELKAIDAVGKPSLLKVQKFEKHLSKNKLRAKYTDALKDLYPDNKSMARILNQYLAQLSPKELKKFEKLLDKPGDLSEFKDVLKRLECTKQPLTSSCMESFNYVLSNYKKPMFKIPEIAKAQDAKKLFKSSGTELVEVDKLVSKNQKLEGFMLNKTPDEQAILGEMIAVHMRNGKGVAKIIDELEDVRVACKL